MSDNPLDSPMPLPACYRLRRTFLVLGVVSLILFLAMDLGSVYVAYWNIDGSFQHPLLAAVIFGIGWSSFVLLSLLIIAAYVRERLFIATGAITQFGIFRRRSIPRHDITQILWRRFPGNGRIVLRSPTQRINIDLANYTQDEQQQLIAYFQATVPPEIQLDKESFLESRHQRAAPLTPQQERRIGLTCTLILFVFASACTWCWWEGLGIQFLVAGLFTALASAWYALRLFRAKTS